MENVLDWKPMEGITNLERSALGCPWTVDLWRGRRVWEQSVLSSSLAVRPVEGVTEKVSDWKSGY